MTMLQTEKSTQLHKNSQPFQQIKTRAHQNMKVPALLELMQLLHLIAEKKPQNQKAEG